jgi:glyceraldehyde 3-phosphate dehydrogenase
VNKKIKLGLNGLGRIGRTLFRKIIEENLFDIVQINDINPDINNIAYLLKYDSVHGKLPFDIQVNGNLLIINGNTIKFTHEPNIENVKWDDIEADIVIECSGFKPNIKNAMKCIFGSVKKVIFSDSPNSMDITLVHGVNVDQYSSSNHHIIAASICDIVGTAPVLSIMSDLCEIKSAFLQTLHPWLSYQNMMDGPLNQDVIQDPRGKAYGIGRATPGNLIPKNTSLGDALNKVIPELKGKTTTMSFRVPTEIVGSCSMILEMDKPLDSQEIIKYLISNSKSPIVECCDEPLISSDFKHHESSCIIDTRWIETNNQHVRIVTWYDNEWGYVNRLYDTINLIADKF